MRSILILNPKGGSGKSTLAMNIAGYFASQGRRVALADCDQQASCNDWLAVRGEAAPAIHRAAIVGGKLQVKKRPEVLIIDSPAASHGAKLAGYVKHAQTVIIPVLPSPLDMRAAERFIDELYGLRKLINKKITLATVANRMREDTIAAAQLENYLGAIKLPGGRKLPFITTLRASQNYVKAAEKGLSIFEFAPAKTLYDREQWEPLLRWLKSHRSIPS
ncbi:MAG: AAA family ATPase [Gammaproteobacteria bacterium]